MIKQSFANVANATVKLPKKGGQGVLVKNGYLITAAHCLDYDSDVGLAIALEIPISYEIETAQGERLKVAPTVIESCSDIAVLGSLDGQVFYDESIAFESFCDRTRPVPLCRKRLDKFPAEFGVHIYTHKSTWVSGKATIFRKNSSVMSVSADENIEGGTSGGPIINESGELVGIVSTAGGSDGETKRGRQAFLRWALPIWIYREICGSKFYFGA